jgi:hypothetical protein
MPATRLDLSGAAIVRADAVDVPSEAARSERPGGAAWEPTFLISARVELDEDGGLGGAGDRVARTFERVVTTLHLHKPGGVGLGPHGWVRVAGDRWRRIATGAGKPRPGGYRLTESELEPLTDLSRTVAVHPRRISRMRRALLRFEAGLDRRGAVDALNDHLLALRFLLEGEGPAGVGLPMRVAALAEDPDGRGDAKQVVEQAISLERELWSGEPMRSDSASGPSEIAGHIEELLRTILLRGVTGEIGTDFRAAADEALLADGLAFGEGSPTELGTDTEWDFDAIEVEGTGAEPEPPGTELDLGFDRDGEEIIAARIQPDPAPEQMPELEYDAEAEPADREEAGGPVESGQRSPERKQTHLPLIVPGDEVPEAVIDEEPPTRTITFLDEEVEAEPVREPSRTAAGAGWLDEVDGDATMDFPARPNHLRELSRPPMDREEVRARVEYLFPRTETNWTVGSRAPRRAAG